MFLRFGRFANFIYGAQGKNLGIGTEFEDLMQAVGKIGPRVGGNQAFTRDGVEVHRLKTVNDFVTGVSILQAFLEDAIDHQGDEAGDEMGLDAVILTQIDGTCLELALHDAEALFNLPAALIDLDDFRNLILQIRADGIETIVHFLFKDLALVQTVMLLFGHFTLRGRRLGLDEALIIMGMGASELCGLMQGLLRPQDLCVAYAALIIPVFEGVGHDQALFKAVLMHPTLLVEGHVVALSFVHSAQIEGTAVALRLPSRGIERPLFKVLFEFLEGLGRDEGALLLIVEATILQGGEAGIRADNEACQLEVRDDFLFEGFETELFIEIALVDAEGQGDAIAIHEESHLDDRVRAVFLRDPVLLEAGCLLDLKKVIGAVVIQDTGVAVEGF